MEKRDLWTFALQLLSTFARISAYKVTLSKSIKSKLLKSIVKLNIPQFVELIEEVSLFCQLLLLIQYFFFYCKEVV